MRCLFPTPLIIIFFHSSNLLYPEQIQDIICKLEDPLIDSHHDMIISTWTLENAPATQPSSDNITAPKIDNHRHKVLWTNSGIEEFQDLVLPHLKRIQDLWLSSPSRSSLSMLLDSTSTILTSCASLTNKTSTLAST